MDQTKNQQAQQARQNLAQALRTVAEHVQSDHNSAGNTKPVSIAKRPHPTMGGQTFFALPGSGRSGNPHPIVVRNSMHVFAANDAIH